MRVLTKSRSGGAILAFGVVLLNTLPVWLAELASLGGLSDAVSGVLASLILLASAVGCFQGALFSARGALRLFGVAVVASFAVAAAATGLPAWGVFALALTIGTSLGIALNRSLAVLAEASNPTASIGVTISVGLVISLAILVAVAALETTILPIIAVSAALAIAVAWPELTGDTLRRTSFSIQFWQLLPFFVAMGAYWVFLELFAQSQGIATIVGWIAASLIASAIGSALAGRIAPPRRGVVRSAALLLAALTAGATYLAQGETLIGIMILANAFFLFLYLPIYLAAPSQDASADAMTGRMAVYLLGFAFGGIAGTALLSLGGYSVLALAIAATGLAAFVRD